MKPMRGLSLIDVLVGTALSVVIFLALFGLLRASLLVSSLAKAKAGATAVADSQMEYIRSLDYDSVGVAGGIPAGTIPQYATTTLNSIPYGVRTLIEYYDDAKDGLGASDSNGITTDYRRIKIAITYYVRGKQYEVDVISNYAPPSIETTVNGGTLKVAVVNASGVAVSGASVRVQNTSTSPTIDFTTFSDITGSISLPGAPTSTQYQIAVSKAGYSSAQTYARDATNQNPNPGYFTVAKNQTTTGTFAIDLLSSLTLRTFLPIATGTSTDSFPNSSNLSSMSNTVVSTGAVALSSVVGVYSTSGTAVSTTTAPTYLASWTSASATESKPASTDILVRVVDSSGTPLSETDLPGNSAGFTTFPINLSTVSTTTYPSLALSATLTTSDTTVTPQLQDWALVYKAGPTPVPNVAFTLTGAKTTGSTGAGAAIYKTNVSNTTDSTGSRTMSLEWDSYKLGLTSNDVIDACTPPPYALTPGVSYDQSLYLGTATTNRALISVRDNAGNVVPGASVTLARTGFTQTVTTSNCGTAYFGGVTSATNYTVTISKSGYTTSTYTNVSVSGQTFYAASFP
ncbi:MAG: Autotransporter adhesin [Parcubacteria group bacterium]|nr:Autotransporter adhesin [Parcubacteria group bacterium]